MRGTLADEVRRRTADLGLPLAPRLAGAHGGAGRGGRRDRGPALHGRPRRAAPRHLDDSLAPAARQLGAYAATDIAAFPERLEKAVAALPRGRLQHGAQLHDQIRDLYEEQVYHHLNAQAALLVSQLLLDMCRRVLGPLAAPRCARHSAAWRSRSTTRSPTPGWPGWPRTT